MSKKIPFLQMFAALRRWTELAQAVEGWLIVTAAIDKASRSATITVEGAGGADPNLVREAEETLACCYGLNSVKLKNLSDNTAQAQTVKEEPVAVAEPPHKEGPAGNETEQPQDAFARAEAIRRAAMKNVSRPASPKGDKKPAGKAIFGKPIS